jgi:2'-5' RNA ligase
LSVFAAAHFRENRLMRMFIAIELSDDVRLHLIAARDRIASSIGKASFTADVNLHITLKFLGEVDPRQQAQLTESLSLIRTGGSIDLQAAGIECFPPRGPVRIIAAGFGGDRLGAMRALHAAVEQRCQHLAFDREQRAYRPHVTLARARPVLPPATRQAAAEAAKGLFPGPVLRVDQIALISSRLLPNGAQYTVAERFPIA